MRASARRYLPGTLVSVACLVALFWIVDVGALRRIGEQFDPVYAGVFVALCFAIQLIAAERWRRLLGRQIHYRDALAATVLGFGGNMVLPARGGDLARVYYSARLGPMALHKPLSRLVLEKVLDLLAAFLFGGAGLLWLARSSPEDDRLETAAWPVLAAAVLLPVLIASGSRLLGQRLQDRVPRFARPVVAQLEEGLVDFREASRTTALGVPAVLTGATWLLIYPICFWAAGRMVGVDLGFAELQVLMLAATVGYAIPAAPSAIGTLHASLLSAFALMGRHHDEGISYAIALHSGFFIVFLVAAAALFPLLSGRGAMFRENAET
jgi:uncharacterized protein (TIRG00374 family)